MHAQQMQDLIFQDFDPPEASLRAHACSKSRASFFKMSNRRRPGCVAMHAQKSRTPHFSGFRNAGGQLACSCTLKNSMTFHFSGLLIARGQLACSCMLKNLGPCIFWISKRGRPACVLLHAQKVQDLSLFSISNRRRAACVLMHAQKIQDPSFFRISNRWLLKENRMFHVQDFEPLEASLRAHACSKSRTSHFAGFRTAGG